MSSNNGDKARFGRTRKKKLQQRQRTLALRKAPDGKLDGKLDGETAKPSAELAAEDKNKATT